MGTHFKALAARTNPKTLALFPLEGSILLPGTDLPLNVFEPRYLNLVDDALKAERLIGIVQPRAGDQLYDIGGLGRILQFAEMEDGRYMIVVRGLKRFRMVGEPDTITPYRQGRVSFDEFQGDVDVHEQNDSPEALKTNQSERGALTMAMKSYAKTLGVELDWDSLRQIPLDRLVDQAAMISPFKPSDKQSLLEAKSHAERRHLLIGLMHLYSDPLDGGTKTVQ